MLHMQQLLMEILKMVELYVICIMCNILIIYFWNALAILQSEKGKKRNLDGTVFFFFCKWSDFCTKLILMFRVFSVLFI